MNRIIVWVTVVLASLIFLCLLVGLSPFWVSAWICDRIEARIKRAWNGIDGA